MRQKVLWLSYLLSKFFIGEEIVLIHVWTVDTSLLSFRLSMWCNWLTLISFVSGLAWLLICKKPIKEGWSILLLPDVQSYISLFIIVPVIPLGLHWNFFFTVQHLVIMYYFKLMIRCIKKIKLTNKKSWKLCIQFLQRWEFLQRYVIFQLFFFSFLKFVRQDILEITALISVNVRL